MRGCNSQLPFLTYLEEVRHTGMKVSPRVSSDEPMADIRLREKVKSAIVSLTRGHVTKYAVVREGDFLRRKAGF